LSQCIECRKKAVKRKKTERELAAGQRRLEFPERGAVQGKLFDTDAPDVDAGDAKA